ncbi:phage major capsid protein, HK97 family [Nitratireductor aquibiodomus]|uniref:Phage major capsid protein, HK97 family n=1 Tax=Nitratireductor aquibiodomus TaxID=204799 RepID=A0A1H4N8V9_9HYPH|nr:phage major capsid protein [Nitratireductor aquibiodomus]SEB91673.1 phage major capsid protein, HK97 family [Nitratireductor aquibiodomus]
MTAGQAKRAPEVKSALDEGDVTGAFHEFMNAFETFKEANNEKLKQLETRSADVVTVDKVERISQALDEQKQALDTLVLKKTRPVLGRGGAALHDLERKQAFDAYMRSGDERGMRSLEEKAMSYGSAPDGGYLVPDETEAAIGARLAELSPIRSIASVRQVSSAVLKKPFAVTGPAVGWVAETAARPETATGTLDELQFPTAELYAMPAATAMLLDDAVVDLDQWIASEVETAFAEQEGAAFVNGDGINKPKGFLSYARVANATWSWGNVGYNVTGAAGALPATDSSDVLIDLVYALKAGYRQSASWVMNRKTQATLRKLKDADGNYMWQPPATPGSRAMLMGFPLVEAEDMPDIGADTTPIAFGDFRRFYLVVDRAGVRVLRDPYSAKPYVLFYTTKRVGGGIQDFDAVKLLKFGTV